MQTDPRITLDIADGIACVTIRRPEAKNALTKSMYAAIRDACRAADANSAVEAVVLRGVEGAFAVGGDLKEMLEAYDIGPERLLDYENYLPFETVRTLSKPTIA